MNKFFSVLILFFALVSSAFAEDLRFVQIDGLGFRNDENSINNFNQIITEINKQKNVDFVVFTGNNIAKPKQQDLEIFLKQAKKLKAPFYVVLGNKDVNKQKNLSKSDYLNILGKNLKTYKKIATPNYVFEKKGVVFLVLDGSKEVIPSSMGYYRPETVSWMDEKLSLYKDKNVIILQHFPIIPPAEKESRYTSKPENYLKTLAKHKNVKAIVSGHFGVNKESDINGIKHIYTADFPVYRIIDLLDCNSKNLEIWSVIKD